MNLSQEQLFESSLILVQPVSIRKEAVEIMERSEAIKLTTLPQKGFTFVRGQLVIVSPLDRSSTADKRVPVPGFYLLFFWACQQPTVD